jgi:hypothetical protein
MRLPMTLRIRTWLLAGAERLWSQLTPRRQASEIAAVAMDAMRDAAGVENRERSHPTRTLRWIRLHVRATHGTQQQP